MERTTIYRGSLLVAVLLVGLLVYPGALAAPYVATSHSYAVADDSTEVFESFVESNDVDPETATPMEELSEATEQTFKTAKEEPRTEYDHVDGGWQSIGSAPLCNDWLLYCDGVEEEPDFPSQTRDTYESYGFVEYDGDVYLVREATGTGGNWGLLVQVVIEFISRLGILLPYAGFLAATRGTFAKRGQSRYLGYGLLLALVAFAYPYLVMSTSLSEYRYILALAGLTYLVIVVGAGEAVFRAKDDEQ